jgi:hypothetical protein
MRQRYFARWADNKLSSQCNEVAHNYVHFCNFSAATLSIRVGCKA